MCLEWWPLLVLLQKACNMRRCIPCMIGVHATVTEHATRSLPVRVPDGMLCNSQYLGIDRLRGESMASSAAWACGLTQDHGSLSCSLMHSYGEMWRSVSLDASLYTKLRAFASTSICGGVQIVGQTADLVDLQRILQRSKKKLNNSQQQNATVRPLPLSSSCLMPAPL